jgi:hypothetical protein
VKDPKLLTVVGSIRETLKGIMTIDCSRGITVAEEYGASMKETPRSLLHC